MIILGKRKPHLTLAAAKDKKRRLARQSKLAANFTMGKFMVSI